MGKNKFKPELLSEELKKFRLLSEYTFYNESSLEEADDTEDPNAPPPANGQAPPAAPADDSKTAANAAPDAGATPPAPAAPTDAAGPAMPPADDANNTFGTDDGSAEVAPETAPDDLGMGDADAGNDVELDVTDLVKNTEDATHAAMASNHKSDEILAKFNDLERKVASMDAITGKIEDLEKEIIKRNPTPVEKLEMRSMNSFPYNIKLSDYWKDVDGYDPMSHEGTPKEKEYVLTKADVNNSFTDSSIKKSFDVPDDYEEEEIY